MRCVLLAALILAAPAAAQDHGMHHMPGMTMPSPGPAAPSEGSQTSTQPVGDAPPPPTPDDHYADRVFGTAAMAPARARMMRESGGQSFHQLFFNLAEVQPRKGGDGYRWDGEGWYGGDIDRAVVKTEGDGRFGNGVERAEVQALYSRAIGPYFDLQGGVRQDLGRGADRSYAVLGVEGLAPYWFDVEASAFLSTRGELLARLEGWYDQRLTQRLVLQPRVELNLAAQDSAATRTGAGLVDAELGLRLRYELARQFAPYLGLSYEARTGASARYARRAGDDPDTLGLVAGVRFWF